MFEEFLLYMIKIEFNDKSIWKVSIVEQKKCKSLSCLKVVCGSKPYLTPLVMNYNFLYTALACKWREFDIGLMIYSKHLKKKDGFWWS